MSLRTADEFILSTLTGRYRRLIPKNIKHQVLVQKELQNIAEVDQVAAIFVKYWLVLHHMATTRHNFTGGMRCCLDEGSHEQRGLSLRTQKKVCQ